MGYQPKLLTQLNNGTDTATRDCAVMTALMAIDFGTRGQWVPSVQAFRVAAGNPDKGLTSKELMRGMRWALREATAKGFPFELQVFRPAASIARLKAVLRAGWFAGVATKYAVINEKFIAASGQRSLNYRKVNGKRVPVYHELGLFTFGATRQTLDYDPLFDGRRSNVPRTPVMVPFGVMREAMGGFAGKGLFIGFATRPAAEPEQPGEPEPDPCAELHERIKQLHTDIKEAELTRDAAIAHRDRLLSRMRQGREPLADES